MAEYFYEFMRDKVIPYIRKVEDLPLETKTRIRGKIRSCLTMGGFYPRRRGGKQNKRAVCCYSSTR